MSIRETELQELRTIYKLKYGYAYDSRRKVFIEELIHVLESLTDEEIDNAATFIGGDDKYHALYKLVVSSLIGLAP